MSLWTDFRDTVEEILPIVVAIFFPYLAPELGSALLGSTEAFDAAMASAKLAGVAPVFGAAETALGAGAISAGSTLARGGTGEQALQSGLIGAVSPSISGAAGGGVTGAAVSGAIGGGARAALSGADVLQAILKGGVIGGVSTAVSDFINSNPEIISQAQENQKILSDPANQALLQNVQQQAQPLIENYNQNVKNIDIYSSPDSLLKSQGYIPGDGTRGTVAGKWYYDTGPWSPPTEIDTSSNYALNNLPGLRQLFTEYANKSAQDLNAILSAPEVAPLIKSLSEFTDFKNQVTGMVEPEQPTQPAATEQPPAPEVTTPETSTPETPAQDVQLEQTPSTDLPPAKKMEEVLVEDTRLPQEDKAIMDLTGITPKGGTKMPAPTEPPVTIKPEELADPTVDNAPPKDKTNYAPEVAALLNSIWGSGGKGAGGVGSGGSYDLGGGGGSTGPGSAALAGALRTDAGAPIFGGEKKGKKRNVWNIESLRTKDETGA